MSSLIILFILSMIDFGLTYYGVNIGIIEEANPLLVWLFDLPLIWSALMRIFLMMLTPFIPLYILYRKQHIWFQWGVRLSYVLNAFVMCLHAQWIYVLIKYV